MTKKEIRLTVPVEIVSASGNTCQIVIHKNNDDDYRVPRAKIKGKTDVTWKAGNFKADDIIVDFPPFIDAPVHASDFPVSIEGNPGVYQYRLWVIENGRGHQVEGNSPPEMIIE